MICKFIEDLNTMAEYNLINGNELVGQIALSSYVLRTMTVGDSRLLRILSVLFLTNSYYSTINLFTYSILSVPTKYTPASKDEILICKRSILAILVKIFCPNAL